MSPRRFLAVPVISFCALLVACQAKTVDGTSIGGGPPPPAPPALPPAPASNSGLNETGGGAGQGSAPDENTDFLNIPLPTGAPEVVVDAGQPQVETMVNQNCAQTTVTAVDTTVLVPADIIIAVDTSSSMALEAGFVQEQMNAFSQQIIASGVDARVILIAQPGQAGEVIPLDGRNTFAVCIGTPLGSGTCPEDSNAPSYLHINQYVGSHDALEQFINTFPQWKDSLRPNSQKAFMVVSDDESTVMTAEEFVTQLQALDATLFTRWNMNGVFSYSMCVDDNNERLADGIGEVYKTLVTQTNGISGDLCEQNFQPVFDNLATQIVENAGAEIVCEWEIPPAVDGQTFSTELVDVLRTTDTDAGTSSQNLGRVTGLDACAAGGWYFDDNYNPSRIVACESTCAAMQDDANGGIDVVFGCEVVEGCAASNEAALQGDNITGSTSEAVTSGAANEPVGASTGEASVSGTASGSGVASGSGSGVASEPPAPPVAVACEWPLPELDDRQQQLDLENVNVRYTTSKGFGVLMGSVTGPDACAQAELGWYFDNPEKPTKIVACPETCEILTSRQVTEVNALFGCKTRPAKPRTL